MVMEIIYLLMVVRKIHLMESFKNQLITFFINYGDEKNEEKLNRVLWELEKKFRADAHYYIKRGDYNPNEVIEILDTIKREGFFEQGLKDVEIAQKEFLIRRLHTIFRNIENYMKILRNWYR